MPFRGGTSRGLLARPTSLALLGSMLPSRLLVLLLRRRRRTWSRLFLLAVAGDVAGDTVTHAD